MQNSPESKSQQNPQPNQPPSANPELMQLRQQKDVLSRLLWTLVRQANPNTHTAEVPAVVSDPLWELVLERGSKDDAMRILAGAKLPMTESQRKKVIRFLRDTAILMPDALIALKYEYPSAHVEKEILPWLKWADGRWVSVRDAGLVERAMNAVGIPKA